MGGLAKPTKKIKINFGNIDKNIDSIDKITFTITDDRYFNQLTIISVQNYLMSIVIYLLVSSKEFNKAILSLMYNLYNLRLTV